jgi:hypothetical protein
MSPHPARRSYPSTIAMPPHPSLVGPSPSPHPDDNQSHASTPNRRLRGHASTPYALAARRCDASTPPSLHTQSSPHPCRSRWASPASTPQRSSRSSPHPAGCASTPSPGDKCWSSPHPVSPSASLVSTPVVQSQKHCLHTHAGPDGLASRHPTPDFTYPTPPHPCPVDKCWVASTPLSRRCTCRGLHTRSALPPHPVAAPTSACLHTQSVTLDSRLHILPPHPIILHGPARASTPRSITSCLHTLPSRKTDWPPHPMPVPMGSASTPRTGRENDVRLHTPTSAVPITASTPRRAPATACLHTHP